MNRAFRRGTRYLLLILCLGLWSSSDALAEFDLTVRPQGKTDLVFQPIREGLPAKSEDVTFTVSTDEGKRYQITQSLESPLRDDRTGQVLPADRVKFVAASGAASGANLRPINVTSLRQGSDVLYTSGPEGDADQFVLTFAVEDTGDVPAGIYQSQLVYILEAVEGGASPVTVIRAIRVEIVRDFGVTVKNERGSQELNLGAATPNNPGGRGKLIFDAASNAGASFRIYQQVSGPLSSDGGILQAETIGYTTSQGQSGRLSLSPQILFVSDDRNEGSVFEAEYALDAETPVPFGSYESMLSFSVESEFGDSRTLNVPLRVEVSPVFHLDVDYDGVGSLNFGTFESSEFEKTRTVRLKINSNRGARYQVSQITEGPLVGEDGKAVKPENFTVLVNSEKSS